MEANYFTILYWFCHTSTWICHGCTCVPHPEPLSLLPPHTIPVGRLSAPAPSIQYHALKKEMASHSSVFAWRIPGTGELGGLPSMGLHRVGHDWSDLAAAAAAYLLGGCLFKLLLPIFPWVVCFLIFSNYWVLRCLWVCCFCSLYIEAPGYVPVLLENLCGMSCSGTCWLLCGAWFQCRVGGF